MIAHMSGKIIITETSVTQIKKLAQDVFAVAHDGLSRLEHLNTLLGELGENDPSIRDHNDNFRNNVGYLENVSTLLSLQLANDALKPEGVLESLRKVAVWNKKTSDKPRFATETIPEALIRVCSELEHFVDDHAEELGDDKLDLAKADIDGLWASTAKVNHCSKEALRLARQCNTDFELGA